MTWNGVSERVSARVAVSVRVADAVVFGTLRSVHGDRLTIEAEAEFPAGEPAELRIELTPHAGTAFVHGHVDRRLLTGVDEQSRFVVRVTEVPPDDDVRFRAWIEQMRTGGTVKDFSVFSDSRRSVVHSQTRASEARQALASMDTRSVTRALQDRTSSVTGGGGRDRIREALRKVLARRVGAGSRPEVREGEPTYTVEAGSEGVEVQVTWTDAAVFQEDLKDMLFHHALVLREQGTPLPDAGPMLVRIRHGELDLLCAAGVIDHGPLGATFKLILDGKRLATLLRVRAAEPARVAASG